MTRTFLLLCLFVDTAAAAPTCDTSTDDAAAKVYEQLSGLPLPAEHRCISRSRTFVGLFQVGGFAYDRGCEWTATVYQCAMGDADTAKKAMAAAGWPGADAGKKKVLAFAWLREVVHDDILEEKPTDGQFKKRKFSAPSLKVAKDGSATAQFWVAYGGGMRRGADFVYFKVRFDADGVIASRKEVSRFSWTYK